MKILSKNERPSFGLDIGATMPGDCIEFKQIPHQKHAEGSIFLVLRVPAQYIDESARQCGTGCRVMVANLESGDVSLVAQDRLCRFVKAEVTKL